MNISKKNNRNKYLVSTSTDGNEKVLVKLTQWWNEIKQLTQTLNKGKKGEYVKDFMKIRFESDDTNISYVNSNS